MNTNRFVFASDQMNSFNEIFNEIENDSQKCKALAQLRKKTFSRKLQYESDFLSSGLAEYIISSITLNNDFLSDFLEIVRNLAFCEGSNQYITDMCNLGLISTLDNIIYHIDESNMNIDNIRKIITMIIIIINCISVTNTDIKYKIVDNSPLEKIIEFVTIYSEGTDLISLIYYLFSTLLNIESDEASKVHYFSKFEKYFPQFEELYNKKKDLEPVNIVKLFYSLIKIPSFIENPIIDDILKMVLENDDQILECVLAFTYKILKKDMSKGQIYIDRYYELTGNNQASIVDYSVKIIRFIMKYRPDWISVEKYYPLAISMMNYAKNSDVSRKIIFLKCLFMVTEKCDNDCLIKILSSSYVSFIIDFLDFDDDNIISSVISEINYLTDEEVKQNGTNEVLYKFLDNGGSNFFKEYKDNGSNQDIVNQILAILKKYNIDLD